MRWLQKLFANKPECRGIVGISFLPMGIAIAIANYSGNGTLRLICCQFIPGADNQSWQRSLDAIIDQYTLAHYDCHLVLNHGHYQRINIDAPAVPDGEISEAIRWKINDLIEFPLDKAVIDFYPSPPAKRANSAQMLEVIACSSDQIELQAEKCINAGLQLKVIDIQETVLRNLAALLPENHRGIAILHLLEATGTILIEKDSTIYLSRQFDIGYKKLNLDCYGIDSTESARQTQTQLALEIQRSLDYVESYYGIPPISGVAIIPLAEHTQNLVDILNQHLGISTRIMDLCALIDCDILLDDATQSLCSPVIGATLRHQISLA